jgi:hypothetical protein
MDGNGYRACNVNKKNLPKCPSVTLSRQQALELRGAHFRSPSGEQLVHGAVGQLDFCYFSPNAFGP